MERLLSVVPKDPPPSALVLGDSRREAVGIARTTRALAAAGCALATTPPRRAERANGIWLVRAGAWPTALPQSPPPRAAGGGLCALGAVAIGDGAAAWSAALRAHGGDFGTCLPDLPLPSVWLDAALAADLDLHQPDPELLRSLLEGRRARVVRWPALDVATCSRLRVAQVVTSLQQGGAERVAVTLHAEADRNGIASLLVPIGTATRAELPLAPSTAPPLRLPPAPTRSARAENLAARLAREGVDVVHAHLLEPEDLTGCHARGIPVVLTVHNQEAGWQPGTRTFGPEHARVLVGCCAAVTRELAAAGLDVPLRTVRNGVAPTAVRGTREGALALRARLQVPPESLVLVALANPRPQKRLWMLPGVLAALRERAPERDPHLLLVGSVGRGSETARAEQARCREEAVRFGLTNRIHELGALAEPGDALRAADVLVCTSAWEGLSVAWLEAVAVGTPVVTTAVGGAAEVQRFCRGVQLVAPAAPVAEFANAILASAAVPRETAPVALTSTITSGAYARLLTAVAIPSHARSGLWLVTNNLATGGAQTSARRLLTTLAARGVRVRASAVEEDTTRVSSGTEALRRLGVEVHVPAEPGTHDAGRIVLGICEAMRADPPEAVFFWNLQPVLRVMLAEALVGTRVVDVSPGEMWGAALERYFAAPRPEVASSSAREYGALLAGVVVKHAAEAASAHALTGAEVHVIRNGVPLAAPAQGTGTPFRIGTLARLSPQKRLEELFAALRIALPEVPPCELHVGGAPERGTEEYAAALRAAHADLPLVWRGHVEAGEFLSGLDLFATIAEPAGCPNASLEALAHGLPVVATDHGGMREQVIDGRTGILVPRADARALAAALVRLARDPHLRATLGSAGRLHVREAFSLAAMADAYARLVRPPAIVGPERHGRVTP